MKPSKKEGTAVVLQTHTAKVPKLPEAKKGTAGRITTADLKRRIK